MRHFLRVAVRAWRDTWELVVEKHPKTLLIALFIFLLTSFFTYRSEGWNSMSALFIGSGLVSLATITVFIFILLFNAIFFTPKAICEGVQKELEATKSDKKVLEERLLAIENDKITFSVEPIRDPFDEPNEGVRIFRLKVTNQHSSKEAKNVEVCIESMTSDEHSGLDRFQYPHQLPLKAGNDDTNIRYNCNINPGASRIFNLGAFQVTDVKFYSFGVAPFIIHDTYNEIDDCSFMIYLGEPNSINTSLNLTISVSATSAGKKSHKMIFHVPQKTETLDDAYVKLTS